MTTRTQTLNTAHRIAERLRDFRRPGSSGWSTKMDMDHARTSQDFMIAAQWQRDRAL